MKRQPSYQGATIPGHPMAGRRQLVGERKLGHLENCPAAGENASSGLLPLSPLARRRVPERARACKRCDPVIIVAERLAKDFDCILAQ
jgi:hypothetical protein